MSIELYGVKIDNVLMLSFGRVLISGATGFIGRRLLKKGALAMVRKPTGLAYEVVGDLLEPNSLTNVFSRQIDTVFHCAGYAHAFSSDNAYAHWQINFIGTQNLLQAALQGGVKRFVFLSSVKAMAEPGQTCVDENWLGSPTSAYGLAKLAAERAVLHAGKQYDMHVVNLRLAMVYGCGSRGNLYRMAQGIRSGWFPPLPETGNQRSLVHVDDVMAAVHLVAERPEANGKTYIVADSKAYSGRELYDSICQTLGKQIPSWRVPSWVMYAGGLVGDISSSLARRTLPLNSNLIDRLLGSACYSPARIERELGWRAQIGLVEGLREMLSSEKSL
jgi:UDP-glucose 4-epimerase